jgi:CheY-like chemotaxis protein
LAEDEALVRAVAAAALEEAGFTVLPAADGSEALRLFLEQIADVQAVLLDLAMPKTDGLKVLREIRRLRPAIPVIVASAYDGDDAVARLEGSGPARFIRKPYRPEQLVAAVWDVLKT